MHFCLGLQIKSSVFMRFHPFSSHCWSTRGNTLYGWITCASVGAYIYNVHACENEFIMSGWAICAMHMPCTWLQLHVQAFFASVNDEKKKAFWKANPSGHGSDGSHNTQYAIPLNCFHLNILRFVHGVSISACSTCSSGVVNIGKVLV